MTTIRKAPSAERPTFPWPPILIIAYLMVALVSFGCSRKSETTQPAATAGAKTGDSRMKVAFVTVGPVSDWGYNYAHNQGRIFMEGAAPKEVQTINIETATESAEVERVMEKMIA